MLPVSCDYLFPDPAQADPNGKGLIAVGADLAPDTLLAAYQQGFFPWFSDDNPIAWWCPEPRCVIYPQQFSPSKSLTRHIKKSPFVLSVNRAFTEVIQHCANPRSYAKDTWIGNSIKAAYSRLYRLGHAISIEVWLPPSSTPDATLSATAPPLTLVGGLYGLKLGQAFFGESMFHTHTDASKMAFFMLMQLAEASHFAWVDCQLPNDHLLSLGATTLSRRDFLHQLNKQVSQPTPNWQPLHHKLIPVTQLLQPDLFYNAHNCIILNELNTL